MAAAKGLAESDRSIENRNGVIDACSGLPTHKYTHLHIFGSNNTGSMQTEFLEFSF